MNERFFDTLKTSAVAPAKKDKLLGDGDGLDEVEELEGSLEDYLESLGF